MKHTPFTKKNVVKRILICFFSIAFIVICVSSVAMRSDVTSAKNKYSMSDAIKTSAYHEMASISHFLQLDDLDSVLDTLMSSIDSQLSEASLEVSNEQRIQIRDTLEELLHSLNEHGMIEYDADGDLTELSKSYLSNAASYAATSIVGEDEIALSNTVLSDLVSTEAIDTTVNKIKQSYAEISSQLTDDDGMPLDLSDMKAQLDTLEKGLIDKNGNQISVSKIALRVSALETMMTTLKNNVIASTDYSNIADETNAKLAEIESEIGSVKLSMQSSDSSSDKINDDVNQLSLDVSALALKLKDFNQSDLDIALSDLHKEITDRETAVSTLKDEIESIEQNSTSTSSTLQTSISGLTSDLASLQTSVSSIKSEQLSSLETWRTGVNANITSLQKEVQSLSNVDTATSSTLASLNQSLNAVKGALNNSEQTLSGNIKTLETTLSSVQNQLNNDTTNLSESLSAIQNQLSQINAQIYDSSKTYTPGSYVTGPDGNTYKYIGPVNADPSAIPDPTKVPYDENGKSIYWEKTDSTNALSDQLANINQQTENLENVLSANSYSDKIDYQKGSYVYDAVTGKFYECISDAPAGTDLSDTNYWKEATNATGLSQALSDLVSASDLLQVSLNQEVLERATSDAALQEQIHSTENTELEQVAADDVAGISIFAKIGTLFKKLTSLASHVDSSIADEISERKSATEALQNDIDGKVSDVNVALAALQVSLADSNVDNADAISRAKQELQDALSALGSTLTGDISNLDSSTQANITALLGTIQALQSDLEDADSRLGDDLENAKTTLSSQLSSTKSVLDGQISALDASLSNAITAEKEARVASDAALQAQIHSEANTELEQIAADEVAGVTIFAKIGTLFKKLTNLASHVDSTIADETRERELAAEALQGNIETLRGNVEEATRALNEALENGDDNSKSQAKSNLNAALDALNTALTGTDASLGNDVSANVETVKNSAAAMKAALESSDAELAENLRLTNEQLTRDVGNLTTSIDIQIHDERVERAAADAELQEKIHSAANTELEQVAVEGVEGVTVFAKIGSLFKQLMAQGDRLGSQISEETLARESAAETLQNNINTLAGNVETAKEQLNTAITNGDDVAKSQAKSNLNAVLDALNDALTGTETTLGSDVAANIETVKQSTAAMKAALEGSDAELAENLRLADERLTGNISTLNTSLGNQIAAEKSAREAGDAALQEKIHSTANTDMEQVANDNVTGTTVFAKIGTLFKKLTDLASHVDSSIADEARARQSAAETLQNNINTLAGNVETAKEQLNNAITNGDDAAKSQAKSNLNAALDALNDALTGTETTLGSDVAANIETVKRSTAAMKAALEGSDAEIAENLRLADERLTGNISTLNTSLGNQIAAEKSAREAGDAALQEKIHSTANTDLEQVANNNVTGTTVFAKIGTLLKSLTSESSTRSSKDTELAGQISTETANRATAVSNVDKKILSSSPTTLENTAKNSIAGSTVYEKLGTLYNSITSEASTRSTKDTELAGQISTETANRATAVSNVDKKILSSSPTTLENTAKNSITGSTVYEKLGTLYNSITSEASTRSSKDTELDGKILSEKTAREAADTALTNTINDMKECDQWAQNITLKMNATTGTRMYGLTESDDSAHSGWKMWKLDGASLGLTFKAGTSTVPESDVVITYVGAPAVVVEYEIIDGYLKIYTPTVPYMDLVISSIHVQNKLN